jgi:hypothetical protein
VCSECEEGKKETEAFQAEVEEISRQQAADEQSDISAASHHRHAMVPYCLQVNAVQSFEKTNATTSKTY